MIHFLNKYFWPLCVISYAIVSFLAYGFIKDLYFYLEDYQLIYSFQRGTPYYGWPYQGINLIYYPAYLIFSNHPEGYFIVNLISFIALCLTLSFFVWKLTNTKLMAYLSGLLLASGYVGAQSMFWVMVGLTSNLYLILLLLLLLAFKNYIKAQNFKHWLVTFLIYVVMITTVSHRMHSTFFILLISDVYFMSQDSRTRLLSWRYFKGLILRLSPFFILTLFVYMVFPIIFIHLGESLGTRSPSWYAQQVKNFSNLFNQNFFGDLGNLLVPSSIQTDARIGRLTGIGSLFVFCILLLFSKLDANFKKTIAYLGLLTVISYIVYHIAEYSLIHSSWHRYLFYSYPFFVSGLVIVITKLLIESKLIIWRIFGLGAIVLLLITNIYLSRFSAFSRGMIERGQRASGFFTSLSEVVPSLNGKSLFYFDVANDSPTQSTFNGILAGGIAPLETALASFYNSKIENIKIVKSYNDFLKEHNEGEYKNIYTFFYNKDKKLINTSQEMLSVSRLNKSIAVDLGSQIQTNSSNLGSNMLNFEGNNLVYKTVLNKSSVGSKSKNEPLYINLNGITSYNPVWVDIDMNLNLLQLQEGDFPYHDGSITGEGTDGVGTTALHDDLSRKTILNYISDRENFKSKTQVSSNGFEQIWEAKYIVDGDLSTSWLSNKKAWLKGDKIWLQIKLPENYPFSEIRWISSYQTRLPLSYEYQVSDNLDGEWKTIFSVSNSKVSVNQYIVDKISQVSGKYLRMVITKSSGDFPAITELEVLPHQYDVDSKLADFLMDHPLADTKNEAEFNEIKTGLQNYLKLGVYPLSDKFADKIHSVKVETPIVWGKDYTYSVFLPAGGTKLNGFLIEFPSVPLEANIRSIEVK